MEILEVSADAYAEALPKPSHIFNSASFNVLNAGKCEQLFFLLFKDSKIRLGIILGARNKMLHSPFSAPFGGFEATGNDTKLQQIERSVLALERWASAKNFTGVRMVLPSFFYNSNLLNKVYSCLTRLNFERTNTDLNYHFSTDKFTENYAKEIWYNAYKNLKRSQVAGLTFEELGARDGEKAYKVIALNRSSRGFPLRMSWEQVAATGEVVDIDYFIVKKDQHDIAAAIIFHVAPNIVQVVYWGDLPEYSEFKTMNFLSYHVFKHYKDKKVKIVDIGPSTENSRPNYGLCEFKESIGCDIVIKTEFIKKLHPISLRVTKESETETAKPLIDIGAKEYGYFFTNDANPFISEKFINLNRQKVDRIVHLVQDSDKVQIGLIAGINDGVLLSPFSAPFGGFHCKGENIYTSVIDSFLDDLLLFVKKENINRMEFSLSPELYSQSSNAKIVNALARKGFKMGLPEITNFVDLNQFNSVYKHNASRTYYNQAVYKKLSFSITDTREDQEAIYAIILENRTRFNRPIFMTLEDIIKTSEVFPTDFFKVLDEQGKIAAGAIMYRPHPKIAYALFWGDAMIGRESRAMDFLVLNLWNHYKAAGFSFIDLGISTESGFPNEGLLRFKETHECVSTLRFKFSWAMS